jgi:hypothetical protein
MKLKGIIFTILAAMLLHGCSTVQYVPENERRIERVIEASGWSKNKLYVKTNAWFVETFNSAESVIEYQDKEDGVIMGKYTLEINLNPELNLFSSGAGYSTIRQVVMVDIKDGAVRIRLRDPYFRDKGSYYQLRRKQDFDKLKEKWIELIYGFEGYLKADDAW